MAPRVRALALALVLAGTPMLGALADTPHDDAGSGTDAPDRPADAMNVSPGSYPGNLTPGSGDESAEEREDEEDERGDEDEEPKAKGRDQRDDEDDDGDDANRDTDWYRVNASDETEQLACTQATFTPEDKPHSEARIHLREPAIDASLNATATTEGITLAHVGPSPDGTLAGLTHLDPPRVTEYTLAIDVSSVNDLDGAGALDEIPGPCFGDGLENGEIHEWTFHAEAGEFLYLSFGTELSRMDELTLEAPNGTDIGSIVSEDAIAIGAETLPDTGNYTLTLEAGNTGTASSDYLIGFNTLDPEEEEGGQGCDPHCMKS